MLRSGSKLGFFGTLYLTFKGLQLIKRFFMGQPLDGQEKTNARFLTPATMAYTKDGYASWWAMLPGYQKLFWRLGILFGSPLALATWLLIPRWVILTGALLACIPLGFNLANRWTYRNHNREYVKPLAAVLTNYLGYAATYPTRLWLDVPFDFLSNKEDERKITVRTPPRDHLLGPAREQLITIVEEKLGLRDLSAIWHMQGANPYVEFIPTPRPPDKVLAEQYMEHLLNATEAEPFFGIGRNNKPEYGSWDEESPHLLISMGTGAGKSEVAKSISVQVLRHGGKIFICDYKRRSHRWATGVENVTYWKDIQDIHNGIIEFAAVATQRNIDTDVPGEDINPGPRHVLVLEELNATMAKLKWYWMLNREKDDPKVSPAVTALMEILYMGRAVKCNVVAIGQRLSAKAMGDPDARDNFPIKLLSRYTGQTWKMLAPEVSPMPVSPRKPGRIYMVRGGEAIEIQVVYFKDEIARNFVTLRDHEAVESTPTLLGEQGTHEVVPLRRVTLSEAVDSGIVGCTLKSLQNYSHRDKRFPKPVGKDGAANVYHPEDLQRWWQSKASSSLELVA